MHQLGILLSADMQLMTVSDKEFDNLLFMKVKDENMWRDRTVTDRTMMEENRIQTNGNKQEQSPSSIYASKRLNKDHPASQPTKAAHNIFQRFNQTKFERS